MFRQDSFLQEAEVSGGDPSFANVQFLAGFEGADGATAYTEESQNAFTVTLIGQAQIDTAQKKFGDSSLSTDGGGNDTARTAQNAVFNLASGLWTMEGQFRYTAQYSSFRMLCGSWQTSGSHKSFAIFYAESSNDLRLFLSTNGSSTITKISSAWTPTNGVWYAIAADFDGTTYRLYIDGVVVGSATGVVTLDNTGVGFSVLGQANGADAPVAHMDEVRMTVGVARYAGAYTPATEAFPRE